MTNVHDRWFLGCMFCEESYPLRCDDCHSDEIRMQVYHSDGITTNFYCSVCSVLHDNHDAFILLSKTSFGSYRRDVAARLQDGYLTCESGVDDILLSPVCDEEYVLWTYWVSFVNISVLYTVLFMSWREFFYGKKVKKIRFCLLLLPFTMMICGELYRYFFFSIMHIMLGPVFYNPIFVSLLFHFRRWWKALRK